MARRASRGADPPAAAPAGGRPRRPRARPCLPAGRGPRQRRGPRAARAVLNGARRRRPRPPHPAGRALRHAPRLSAGDAQAAPRSSCAPACGRSITACRAWRTPPQAPSARRSGPAARVRRRRSASSRSARSAFGSTSSSGWRPACARSRARARSSSAGAAGADRARAAELAPSSRRWATPGAARRLSGAPRGAARARGAGAALPTPRHSLRCAAFA